MTERDGETYTRNMPTQGMRYKVQYTGQYPYEAGRSFYAEVRDSWTNVQVQEYVSGNKEATLLLAETRAAELNAPSTALEFTSRLGIHLEALLNDEEANRQSIAEDAVAILDHYVGQLRGRVWGPIGHTNFPAHWVNGDR